MVYMYGCEIWTISKRCVKWLGLLNCGHIYTNVKKFLDNENDKSRGTETSSAQEGMPDIRKKKMGYFGHTQLTPTRFIWRKIEGRGQTKNYVDGEHNRVVRIWLYGSNKEGTR